ncbi:MAG: membrane integrity-associated transporter subunit PqiC [Xanthomonadales bacterium]|nr:hypothetical protein [Xanthomonadales bacterium]MCC6593873.1 membrane integrity-associated transporter subunit PqiC [Xanthomonadales bacterium]MCE7931042.1 hypothetical protein [Xanthomonadales bacterium PRO6]
MKMRNAGPALLALGLSGCLQGVLPNAAERAVYGLPEAAPMQATQRWSTPLQLEPLQTLPPRDGDDVLVLRTDGEFRVLPAVRWSAPLPVLMQELLARQIELSGLAPVVARGATLAAPLRLQAELHAFELREQGTELGARASLSLSLLCARDGRLLARSEAITVESAPVPKPPAQALAAVRQSAALLARQATLWLARADVSGCPD